MTWKVLIDRFDFNRVVKIRAAELHDDGSIAVIQPTLLHKYAPGQQTGDEALLEMSPGMARGFLQAFVDAAWNDGIRPSALAATETESAAQRFHLRDMRNLVAKLTKTDLV